MRYGFIIVFNGAKTLRQCAENALKSVDRLIIVEGAVQCVAHISMDGHSTDGTLEICLELQRARSGRVIFAPSGAPFWRHKLDMCNHALRFISSGDWLIEFDCDEFYFPSRLNEMMGFLEQSDYTAAEVHGKHYYGDLNHVLPMSPYLWGNVIPHRRMFKYQGEPFTSHTPPRMGGAQPEKVFPRELAAKMFGVEMHHVGYVWRSQVELRAQYFGDNSIAKWDRYKATGQFGGGFNAPVFYDGPKPWDGLRFDE